eukprot:3242456-Pleurochrysis_carterae.AAC.3
MRTETCARCMRRGTVLLFRYASLRAHDTSPLRKSQFLPAWRPAQSCLPKTPATLSAEQTSSSLACASRSQRSAACLQDLALVGLRESTRRRGALGQSARGALTNLRRREEAEPSDRRERAPSPRRRVNQQRLHNRCARAGAGERAKARVCVRKGRIRIHVRRSSASAGMWCASAAGARVRNQDTRSAPVSVQAKPRSKEEGSAGRVSRQAHRRGDDERINEHRLRTHRQSRRRGKRGRAGLYPKGRAAQRARACMHTQNAHACTRTQPRDREVAS